jgi:hypothetical protein
VSPILHLKKEIHLLKRVILYFLEYRTMSKFQILSNCDMLNCFLIYIKKLSLQKYGISEGRAILKRLVAGFPPRRPWFEPGSDHVGFVVDKVALGQVFSEYFGFPYQSLFHQLLHNHPHLSSGACTIGQKWPQYLENLVPPH